MRGRHLGRWFSRRICPALSLAAACLAFSTAEARQPYRLCDIDADLFLQFAFPDGGTVYAERLMKWPMAPNLIVLSNEPGVESDVRLAFAQIAEEQVFRDTQLVFLSYKEPVEITAAARNYGFNNLFILIDENAYAQGARQADLQREVGAILGSSDLASGLFADAYVNQWPATRFHARPGLAVDAAVALLPPTLGPEKLVSHIYAIYFMVHAPAAWLFEPDRSISAMFERPSTASGSYGRLSAFGRAFFAVLADTKVAPLDRPGDFQPCAN